MLLLILIIQYTQRFDGGLQAGVGYRRGGLLVQANYSLGLRKLASTHVSTAGTRYEQTAYHNCGCQVALSYLAGPKR